MKKFRIPFKVTCTVTTEVEADTLEDAIDKAYQDVSISGFCGNGGYDKLIGVYGNDTIEAGEDFEVMEELIEEIK